MLTQVLCLKETFGVRVSNFVFLIHPQKIFLPNSVPSVATLGYNLSFDDYNVNIHFYYFVLHKAKFTFPQNKIYKISDQHKGFFNSSSKTFF